MSDRKEPARRAMRETAQRRRENPAAHRRLMDALNPLGPKDSEERDRRRWWREQGRPRRLGVNPETGNIVLDPRPPRPRLGPGGEIGAVVRRGRR